MAKQYYIKKDPSVDGPNVEWIAINGKEFYQLITSPAGKGRYFIDMDDFMIEATEAEYTDWRKEKDHTDYLRLHENDRLTLSLYSDMISEGGNGEDVLRDEMPSTEDEAIRTLELEELEKALKMLESDEYFLIHSLFLSSEHKKEADLAYKIGLTQSGVSWKKKKILAKLKFLLIKSQKSSQ